MEMESDGDRFTCMFSMDLKSITLEEVQVLVQCMLDFMNNNFKYM